MPDGADTVFMQEDVRTEAGAVIVPAGLKSGANRRLAGEDVRKGSVVLPAGRRLAAPDVALAAAIGLTNLEVRRRIRVALFSTGDEIVEPGSPRPAAALYDANRTLLDGMLDRLGAKVTDLGIIKDDPDALEQAIAAAARDHDLVLTSGGVSTGEADHVRSAVEKIGRLVFWRVAIKPGRPVAMGVIRGKSAEQGAAFVGLPGNPVAAFVTFARWCVRCFCGSPARCPSRSRRCRCGWRFPTRRRPDGANTSASRCAPQPTESSRRQASAGGRGRHHLAHRNRRARRAVRRHDDGRAGLDRRISLVCDADGLSGRSDPRAGGRERLVDRLVDADRARPRRRRRSL
jgi:molybdenum cofactor synthesis domain-containing protein